VAMAVIRRLTGTAYGQIGEKVRGDRLVSDALQNRCVVIWRSTIRLSGKAQPARAATAFAGTWRDP
jgi:hypothetical protein